MEEQTAQTPLEDLRNDALKHYEDVSIKAHHSSSVIPKAINFYYDYRKMNFWQRIRLAFKK